MHSSILIKQTEICDPVTLPLLLTGKKAFLTTFASASNRYVTISQVPWWHALLLLTYCDHTYNCTRLQHIALNAAKYCCDEEVRPRPHPEGGCPMSYVSSWEHLAGEPTSSSPRVPDVFLTSSHILIRKTSPLPPSTLSPSARRATSPRFTPFHLLTTGFLSGSPAGSRMPRRMPRARACDPPAACVQRCQP